MFNYYQKSKIVNYILLLGGNIGDRLSFLKKAIDKIESQCGKVNKQSAIYETAAWGVENQANFYNQVISIESELQPLILLESILAIEKELGRVRFEKWGERVIDIDILFIDHLVFNEAQLIVPHPQLQNRRFTLIPLLDISVDFIHPVLQRSITELLDVCPDKLEVKKVLSI
jgi:2-amino-4-hydroxy-6-hydroxymethyldihydropteridine diphosphokinase